MRSGDSALHAASRNGDALAVEALINAKADVNQLGV
jgi:ankyrin repeat protein